MGCSSYPNVVDILRSSGVRREDRSLQERVSRRGFRTVNRLNQGMQNDKAYTANPRQGNRFRRRAVPLHGRAELPVRCAKKQGPSFGCFFSRDSVRWVAATAITIVVAPSRYFSPA